MSGAAIKFVKANRKNGLFPSDKLMLAAIAFLIDDGKAACFKSRKEIALESGLSIDTVKRSLKRLVPATLSRRSERHRDDGRSDVGKIEIVGFSDASEWVQAAPLGVQDAPRDGCSVPPGTGAGCTPLYKEEQKVTEETEEEGGLRVADARDQTFELTPSETSSPDPLEAFNSYNRIAEEIGLPIARSLPPGRRKSINARFREHGTESWTTVLDNIRASDFLQGRNDRGWRPNLDWIIKPENYAKILEGTYAGSTHPAKPDRSDLVFQTSRWGSGKWVPKALEAAQ